MKIHFIGIGGIGISALARYFLEKGHHISGSDLASSEIINVFKGLRVKIIIGPHRASTISEEIPDLVIYSEAVCLDNPEIKEAKRLGIELKTYPQAIGELTKDYWTIAISGTHGKGTTTAMISLALIEAGLDPTVIIGTKLKEFAFKNEGASNCRIGSSKYLVIEADEYRGVFLNYWPQIIVLTNIEEEHLDYFKDLDHMLKVYKEYLAHLPPDGVLVANKDDKNITNLLKNCDFIAPSSIKTYSLRQEEAKELKKVMLLPGRHNVSDALAALTAARTLGILDKTSIGAISAYKGAWRRFEIKELLVNDHNITLISDYAHHPSEIKATLQATREKFPKEKIWAVFQPHQYQRTHYLFDDFVGAFDAADEIVLTKIYEVAGREQKDIVKKTNAEELARAIKKRGKDIHFVPDFGKIPHFLREKVRPGDVVLIMGAGSIYKILDYFA